MGNNKKIVAPAAGDRIDIGGKKPQFEAFAHYIYQHLLKGDLDWVKIADDKADKLDDIQFATTSEIHAFQMKWSNQSKLPAFTYANFKQLLLEMIPGWKALKAANAGSHKVLHVHMITNRPASTKDRIPDRKSNDVGSLHDFMQHVILPLKANQKITGKWIEVLALLRKDTGLSKHEFFQFMDDFYATLTFALPDLSGIKKEDAQKRDDFNKLKLFIIDEIADKKKRIHFTFSDLINELGWQYRFRTTFNHEFIVDKARYEPITATISELDAKISDFSSGYIYLSGTPGSGKSTLLTQWSKDSSHIVVRYYAFSNTSISQNFSDRGEAEKLYFDLVVQLNAFHYTKPQTILPHHDEAYLRGIFFKQLDDLSEHYANTGQKTLIIVDGLDHIPREYQTTKSLLRNLPSPESIPEGVLLVLGSQTFEIDNLQPDVKAQFRNGGRSIAIQALNLRAVRNYLQKHEPALSLSDDEMEKIYHLSNGHPLQLTYVAEELSSYPQEKSTILAREGNYQSIEDYYFKIWGELSEFDRLHDALALMARIQGEIKLDFVSEWALDQKTLTAFRSKAMHLFSRSTNILVFFHNSFRQFIIRQTSLNILLDTYSKELDQSFHRKLAELYSKSVAEPQWNRLFHLYQSDQKELFLKEANRSAFTDQILSFRPIEKVIHDVRLGLNIATELNDPVVLCRFLFLLTEMEYRENNFNPINFVKEHLLINNYDIAIRYMRDDHILQSSKQFAIRISHELYLLGHADEGAKLFGLGEPAEVREEKILVDASHEFWRTTRILEDWAKSAALYYDINKLVQIIECTEITEAERAQNANVNDLKSRLFFRAARTLAQQMKWEQFDTLLEKFDLKRKNDQQLLLVLLIDTVHIARKNRLQEKEASYYARMISSFERKQCSAEQRVKIAMLIFQRTRDVGQTKRWISGVVQPQLASNDHLDRYSDLREYEHRIVLNVLLEICGMGISPTIAVPSTGRDYDNTMVSFERMLCTFASFRADVILKKFSDLPIHRIRPLIEFYYITRRINDTSRYRVDRLRNAFHAKLVATVALIGPHALKEFYTYLVQEFNDFNDKWLPMDQVNILFDLIDNGLEKKLILPTINDAAANIMRQADMAQRVNNAQTMVSRLIGIGEHVRVEYWMRRAIEESLAIGYSSDGQLNTWMDWLSRINSLEPAIARDRILFYLERLDYVRDVSDHRQYYSAGRKLLNTTLSWNFAAGVDVFTFLMENGLIYYDDAISELVRAAMVHCQKDEISFSVDLFGELLIFLSDKSYPFILRELIVSLNDIGMDDQRALVKHLIDAVHRNALDTYRDEYFAEIIRFASKAGIDAFSMGVPIGTKAAKDNDDDKNEFRFKDGSNLDEAQVLEQITDYESLKKLLTTEDSRNSYFDWHKAIQKIVGVLTKEQILDAAQIITPNNRPSALFTELSIAAHTIGEFSTSEMLADLAINHSWGSGWDKFYDGGSRINAFSALQLSKPIEGRAKAFQTFASDVLSTDRPSSYKSLIDDVLPVLVQDIDLRQIYHEIEEYTKILLANAIPDPRASLALKEVDENWRTSMFRALVYLSHFEAVPIKKEARNFMVKHLPFFEGTNIASLASSEEIDQELLCELLFGNRHDKIFLQQFEQQIAMLSNSESYTIRKVAHGLQDLLDPKSTSPTTKIITRTLSPIYSLAFSKVSKLRTIDHIDADGNIVDTDDVSILTNIVSLQAATIAGMFNFNELNIHHRLYAIMQEIAQPFVWSSVNEKAIRSKLEAVGCQMAFYRPRIEIVFRALSRMIVELADSGYVISDQSLRYFFHQDFDIARIPIAPKPFYITAIDDGKFGREEWVNALSEDHLLSIPIHREPDGWKVIAEAYSLKKMEWGYPEEIVQWQVKASRAEPGATEYYLFAGTFETTVANYPYSEDYPATANVVIVNENQMILSDRRHAWIAFNPKLASELGWTPIVGYQFAWMDTNGELTAKSTFWRSGNIQLAHKVTDGITGDGWFVSISPNGMAQLKQKYPQLLLERRAERTYNHSEFSNKEVSNTQKF